MAVRAAIGLPPRHGNASALPEGGAVVIGDGVVCFNSPPSVREGFGSGLDPYAENVMQLPNTAPQLGLEETMLNQATESGGEK